MSKNKCIYTYIYIKIYFPFISNKFFENFFFLFWTFEANGTSYFFYSKKKRDLRSTLIWQINANI